MVMRDILIQHSQGYVEDGMGGRISDGEEEKKLIQCKISFNTDPEVATAYGVHGEQILYVWSLDPLETNKNFFYTYKEKKYTVRQASFNYRFYYSILIEVKG